MSALKVAIAMEDWDRVVLIALEAWQAQERGEVCVCSQPEVLGIICADCGLNNLTTEKRLIREIVQRRPEGDEWQG